MSQYIIEYTCVRDWHTLSQTQDSHLLEAWFESLPLVLHGNASQTFLWFIVCRFDKILANRKLLPDTSHRWAYVDVALQLISQRKDEITSKAHNLSTANALCL